MYSELALYKTLAGLAVAASILPLIWHVKSKNIPAVCLIVWIGMFNTISFINAFVWGGNIFTAWDGKIFCDIEVKFLIAASAGKMGAIAACAKNLAHIMRDDLPVVKTRAAKRRQLIVDLLFCFGVTTWMIGIHYVIQPDRYWLIEVMGCTPTVDNSWPSIVLVFIWPPITALVATYYCILVLIRLRRHRNEFDKIISNTTNNTTKSRFFRLYIYCAGLILLLLPTTFYTFYRNLDVTRLPYDWELIHDPAVWADIYRIPTNGEVSFDKWIAIGAGLLLFLFFGVGQDATIMYKDWMKRVGLDKHWDRMKKNREDKERKQSFVSDWSGTTNVGKTNSGIMTSVGMNSLGGTDDDPEIATVYMQEGSKTLKQTCQNSPLSNSLTPPAASKSSSNRSTPRLNTSSSNYSLSDLNLNVTNSPLINPCATAAMGMEQPLTCNFAFQPDSGRTCDSGNSQGNNMPRFCTIHEDVQEYHENKQSGGVPSSQRPTEDIRKGKAKTHGTAEASSITVLTEVKVEQQERGM